MLNFRQMEGANTRFLVVGRPTDQIADKFRLRFRARDAVHTRRAAEGLCPQPPESPTAYGFPAMQSKSEGWPSRAQSKTMSGASSYASGSAAMSPVQRGPKACTNCRRRKIARTVLRYFIKCDGARPICNQCRLRPPRSKEACEYPRLEGQYNPDTPTQMLETIQSLRARIDELEFLAVPDPSRVYLNQPYASGAHTPENLDLGGLNLTTASSSPTSPTDMLEPPRDLIANLVDVFLDRFSGSGYFFMEPHRFRQSALLPLPFGHPDRPSPALLSAVYLWGSVLSPVPPQDPYTAQSFLLCVLQNIPQDLNGFGSNPHLALETIQAEVLVSFYYLHTACAVQGRYHASNAASIALSADLHLIRSPQHTVPYPPYALSTPVLLPPGNAADESARINAFWAVIILNNYWVGAAGSPSAVPYGITIDTPWPASAQGGATITNFLNGNDAHGSSPIARLAKASILLERIIAFSARTVALRGVEGPPDPTALASLDRRLHTFQAQLPPLPGAQIPTLVLTHALADLAIVRLHAPYARTSDAARSKCLAAAGRIVAGVGAVNILDDAHRADPMLGPVYATVASMYMNELGALANYPAGGSPRAQAQVHELEARLGSLMGAMASLAAYSPLIEQCFIEMRAAYAGMGRSG
ncbi:hypothetical protein DFH07DRAFT_944975 [Mycena maculata]|uniref:Zn(2)-C6 fungal-type domain-containing protein n=1 Tax=Mycena maculata TaxID=230809 RepID=A0AAD7I2S8_9AGAR|nr:hypothetical protein DFH07DRAFT_944975 [Mycena maculata]